jgi:hypothetical protein
MASKRTYLQHLSSFFLGEDTTMRFSLTPCLGEKGFQQWKDAISLATRMPGGVPPSIRQKVCIDIKLDLFDDAFVLVALDSFSDELYPRDPSGLG